MHNPNLGKLKHLNQIQLESSHFWSRSSYLFFTSRDVEEFYQQCDPEKENLCLYGFPSEQWEVHLPAEEVPPELPEPALGINFARDGMPEKDWLSLVAVHSDAWLLAVSFYFGARFGLDKADRKRLFNLINDLPTVFEIVTGAVKKQHKEKSSISNQNGSKSRRTPNHGLKLPEGFQGHSRSRSHMMKTTAYNTRKMRMSMGRRYVVPVARTMHRMNSGFAATYVRSGSVENA
ncbi:hypothetical protein SASPL_108856 [Salvia splendens]|uniref:PHD finger protein ALFIN-LIKE n=1 Tax=Salvia splendens TaxID=180675 RepID=A0A8X9A709_SALSN|nr:hypothetical protein SASPL_108856 [Salvia splendens]